MAICEMCGKGPQYGHNVSHSKRRTNRRWAPNVQKAAVTIAGRRRRMSICARCLRTLNKV